jgi:hypothetical protein
MAKTKPKDVPLPLADEIVLTRLEACRVARIGLSTFDRAVLAKRLRVQRSGRRISVTREELYRFMGLNADA